MIGRNPDHDQPQIDLFRIELERLLDLQHPMVRLARSIDWSAFEKAFAANHPCGPEDEGHYA